MSQEQCKAVQGFYICELPTGHTCRHREDDYTWMDAAVIDARNAEDVQRRLQTYLNKVLDEYKELEAENRRLAAENQRLKSQNFHGLIRPIQAS